MKIVYFCVMMFIGFVAFYKYYIRTNTFLEYRRKKMNAHFSDGIKQFCLLGGIERSEKYHTLSNDAMDHAGEILQQMLSSLDNNTVVDGLNSAFRKTFTAQFDTEVEVPNVRNSKELQEAIRFIIELFDLTWNPTGKKKGIYSTIRFYIRPKVPTYYSLYDKGTTIAISFIIFSRQ